MKSFTWPDRKGAEAAIEGLLGLLGELRHRDQWVIEWATAAIADFRAGWYSAALASTCHACTPARNRSQTYRPKPELLKITVGDLVDAFEQVRYRLQ